MQVFYMVCYEGHRPAIPEDMPAEYSQLMQERWAPNWEARPPFSAISPRLQVSLPVHLIRCLAANLSIMVAVLWASRTSSWDVVPAGWLALYTCTLRSWGCSSATL